MNLEIGLRVLIGIFILFLFCVFIYIINWIMDNSEEFTEILIGFLVFCFLITIIGLLSYFVGDFAFTVFGWG